MFGFKKESIIDEIKDKRILIFTVSCWGDNGANTLASLFSWVDESNIANVYFRAGIPTCETCNKYFYFSENKIIRSIFKKTVTGTRIERNSFIDSREASSEQNRYSIFRKFRPYTGLFIRELLWKIGKWKSKEFDAFIDDFRPDYIIYPHEGYIYFNRIVNYTIKKTQAKAFGFFWDDNFTFKQHPWNPLYLLYRLFQKASIKKNVKISLGHFSITPMTKKEADHTFKINSIFLTKPIFSFHNIDTLRDCSCPPINITYTGNLGIGRIKSLFELSRALEAVDPNCTLFSLNIYSNTVLTKLEKKRLSKHIIFHGRISSKAANDKQKESDVLLLLEPISGFNKFTPRLSFSTKLADYISRKRCILAIAPRSIASMTYLIENEAALVACNRKEIINALSLLIANNEVTNKYASNAYLLGMKNHYAPVIFNKLQHELIKNK